MTKNRNDKDKSSLRQSEKWTETKISDDTYVAQIPTNQIDKWAQDRRVKDRVDELIAQDGFHIIMDGRSGTIYYTSNGRLCEIDLEVSGSRKFDLLLFFGSLTHWILPNLQKMTEKEKEEIRAELLDWLKIKKMRAEL